MRRRRFLKTSTAIAASTAAYVSGIRSIYAQSSADTLRVIGAGFPNTLDPQDPTSIGRPAQALIENTMDKLVRFGTKTSPERVDSYDYYNVEGELAESWQWSSDGRQLTFKIRKGATFHDGSPVTAHDVKWSLDRAVTHPSTRGQMRQGSMSDPKQFVAVDDHTFRIDLAQKDNWILPDLCHPYATIVNSKVAKKHAAADDPWATKWMRANSTGGGAYKLESYSPGQQAIYVRNDAWKCGKLPAIRRVIYQVVPEAVNRRALIEKGDVDVCIDLPPKDARDLAQAGKVKMQSLPVVNGFEFIGMTNTLKPFDKAKVRQAIAYALPYKKMLDVALFGRGRPLYGGPASKPKDVEWPAPFPYNTDIAKAKALLVESGFPNGFDTTFAFEIGQAAVGEPVALLIQESLAPLGIKVKIDKMPGGPMGSALEKHAIPFYYQQSSAWLNDPVYAFQIFYQGDWRWNLGHFNNAEFDNLTKAIRFEQDKEKYNRGVMRLKEIAFEQVPFMMLWQPLQEVAMQKNINGYRYMPHRNLDFRTLRKA